MMRKLKPTEMHTGCTRCNYQGCIWMREKYGETLGHFAWAITFNVRKLRTRFKLWVASFTALDYSRIDNVVVDGIDMRDAPDFCDAFIAEATYDGRPMTDEELDVLNGDSDFIYDAVQRKLY